MRKSWYGNYMKKTQIIELFKNIQGSLVSFVSMMMFIALGLAIFSGITFSVNTLKNAATNVQMEAAFHDLELYYPYGIDEDNLNTLKETEGVDRIEGIYSTSVLAAYNGNSKIVKFQTIPEIIDTIYELEGEMPLRADEIVIDSVSASANKIKIGDTVITSGLQKVVTGMPVRIVEQEVTDQKQEQKPNILIRIFNKIKGIGRK